MPTEYQPAWRPAQGLGGGLTVNTRTLERRRKGHFKRVAFSITSGVLESRGQCALHYFTLDVNDARRYHSTMILSFKCPDTEALAGGQRVKRFVNIESVARRKLRQLQVAGRLDDLRVPPGNRLEALKGNREGQFSIRINDQFRVCFRWSLGGVEDVEIVDYH